MLTGQIPAANWALFTNRLEAEWLEFPEAPVGEVLMSESAEEFIRALLVPAPLERLCCDGGDCDIEKHGWWDSFDFEAAAAGVYVPPAVNVSHISDTVPYGDFHKVLISKV